MTVTLRFAPSPTGHLHLGGARTALFNWLLVEQARGAGDGAARLLLRLEDTDPARSREEYAVAIPEALDWLGLHWDGEILRQRDRMALYAEHLDRLEREGKAYRCDCDPVELDRAREMARAAGRRYRYPGTCRERRVRPDPSRPSVLRLRVPEREHPPVRDRVVGRIAVSGAEIDDFLLTRSDGTPLYNVCCVVDDATLGITHVVRGADHVDNTRKQALLYDALGFERPVFAHLPLVSGLSKRLGSASVLELRDRGFLPAAVVNYVARLGWSHGDQEVFTLDELVEVFRLDDVGHSPGRVNEEKLRWLNEKHLHRSRTADLLDAIAPWLPEGVPRARRARIGPAIDLYKTRCDSLRTLGEALRPIVADDDLLRPEAGEAEALLDPEIRGYLVELANLVGRLEPFDRATLKAAMWEQLEARGLGFRQVAPACRLALVGKAAGPRLLDVMTILGPESVSARLRRAAEAW